jgi:hypothetical protein
MIAAAAWRGEQAWVGGDRRAIDESKIKINREVIGAQRQRISNRG